MFYAFVRYKVKNCGPVLTMAFQTYMRRKGLRLTYDISRWSLSRLTFQPFAMIPTICDECGRVGWSISRCTTNLTVEYGHDIASRYWQARTN